VVVLPIPLVALGLPFLLMQSSPGTPLFALALVGGIFVAILLMYVAILAYARPLRFELSDAGLCIVWPIRRLQIPWAEIEAVELVDRESFRSRYGYGMRVGSGGLFGAFGWLYASGRRFHLYISRIDTWVLVHMRQGESWILTPEMQLDFLSLAHAMLGGRITGPGSWRVREGR
jgi:hypothetical protein